MKKLVVIIISIFVSINLVYAKETVKFSKCVDGDTFRVIVGKKEKIVRMLAIDTPESVKQDSLVEYYGKEASEYTCKKVTNAKKIELEYDKNSSKYDKYDRLLAWVFVDGELLQEELVANGYAKVAYLYDNYKYADKLKEVQELASIKNIGVWDTKSKAEFDNKEDIDTKENDEDIENKEIIVLIIGFLILVLLGGKVVKKK